MARSTRTLKLILFLSLTLITACSQPEPGENLAEEVRMETKAAWDAYRTYAWGHDILKPVSKTHGDWYEEPMFISPIDAFSTLYIMGLNDEASEIENYVADSLSFDKDVFVKTFELNIRVLGGLVSMYHLTKNEKILAKAEDFGERLLKAYDSPTGMPYYWVNLKTGETKGEIINVAEAGTSLIEMGVLSYYTGNPKYYEAAKKATRAVFDRRSELNLTSEYINIETGEWRDEKAHIGAMIDSYYEYLYKAWLLFGDEEAKEMWDTHSPAIEKYLAKTEGDLQWYGVANSNTGEYLGDRITLWDAFFPGLLMVSGNEASARKTMAKWDVIWNKEGLVPMVYNAREDSIMEGAFFLNPEVIESAYYMLHFTGEDQYKEMLKGYFNDLKTYTKTESGGYSSIHDVRTMEKKDEMATFFFAETLKYLYLGFGAVPEYGLDEVVFSTEAHPFVKSDFDQEKLQRTLQLTN